MTIIILNRNTTDEEPKASPTSSARYHCVGGRACRWGDCGSSSNSRCGRRSGESIMQFGRRLSVNCSAGLLCDIALGRPRVACNSILRSHCFLFLSLHLHPCFSSGVVPLYGIIRMKHLRWKQGGLTGLPSASETSTTVGRPSCNSMP